MGRVRLICFNSFTNLLNFKNLLNDFTVRRRLMDLRNQTMEIRQLQDKMQQHNRLVCLYIFMFYLFFISALRTLHWTGRASHSIVSYCRRTQVIVEGNIASGKTSFLQYFEKRYSQRAEVVYEPVERWRRFHGHNLLGLFYEDPAKYSFSLQACYLMWFI